MAKYYSSIKPAKYTGEKYNYNKKVKKKSYDEIKTSDYDFSHIKSKLEKTIDFDTFQTDISSMGKTIEDTTKNWQTQETLNNNRHVIESMNPRMSAYKEYVRLFGNGDTNAIKGIDEIQTYTKDVLSGWDALSEQYGRYKDDKTYKAETAKLSELSQMKSSDVEFNMNNAKKEAKDLEVKLKKAKEYDEQIKKLSNGAGGIRTVSGVNSLTESVKKAINERDTYLKGIGYDSIESLEQALSGKSVAYTTVGGENITWQSLYDQKKYDEESEALYKNISSMDDFEEYKKKGANIKNPTYAEGERGVSIAGWKPFADDVENVVEYAMDNKANITLSGDERVLYTHLTDKEREIYNYHLGREREGLAEKGTADKYLESINGVLQERHNNTIVSGLVDYTNESHLNSVLGSAISVWQNLGAGGEYLLDSAKYAVTGELDTNHLAKASSAIRNTVAQKVDWEIGNWDAFDFVYNTGMSMVDSTIAMATFGGAGGVALGLSAAAQGTNDALERGLDNKSAFWTGLSAGVFEGLFETYSIGKFKALKEMPVDGVKTIIKNVGKSMLTNASEETLTELANITYDNLVNGYLSQADTDIRAYINSGMSEKEAINKVALEQAGRVVEAGASGALMGLGFGGFTQKASYSKTKAIGKNIKANERAGDVFELASNPEIASAYEAYTQYAGKGINAENATDAQVGALYSNARIEAQGVVDSKKSTPQQKETAQKTIDQLDVYSQAKAESNTGSAHNFRKGFLKDFTSDDIDNLIAQGLVSEEGTESHTLALEYDAKVKEGKKLTTTEIANLFDANSKAIRAEESNEISAKLVEKGENAEIADIVARKMRGEVLTTEEAEKVIDSEVALSTIAEVSNAENVTEELIETSKKMGKEAGALFVALYDGKTDIEEYARAFNLAVMKAENSFGIQDILKSKNVLSNEQVGRIYSELAIKADQKQRVEFQKLSQKTANLKFYKGVINDSVIDYNNTSAKGKVNWNDLDSRQRKAITFMKGFAQATGLNLTLIKDGRKRGYKGAFRASGNTIELDIFAGINIDKQMLLDTIIPTASHELTHWMEKKSPVLYRKVCDVVFDVLVKEKRISEEEIIATEIERLVSKGILKETDSDSTRVEVARGEIVARACEDMLSQSKVGREIFNSLTQKEQKTLIDKLKDIIQKFKDWANDVLNLYKNSATSPEAKVMRQYQEELDRLSKLWDEMLKESVEVNQALEKSGAFEHESGVEGKVLYSPWQKYEFGVSQKDINAFVDKSYKNSNETDYIKYLKPNQRLIDDVSNEVDISEYTHALRDNDIRHIRNSHGEATNEKYPVTKSDIMSIPYIVENYDKVYYKTNAKGQGGIVYVKVMPDNVVYYVEAVTMDYHNEKLLVNKQMVKTGINEIPNLYGLIDAINKKQSNAQYLADLEKIRKAYVQDDKEHYSKDSITIPDENVKTNISTTDSTGRELSEGQMEYFKDSKVRDDNGNLQVMYRGDSDEVTVFDRKKTKHSNLYGRGFYFTNSKAHAEQYGNAREFYLDIKTPLSPNQNAITKKQMLNFLKAIENDGEDYDLYNYGQDATAESVLNSVWGKGDFEMLQDVNAGAIGDLVAAVELFNKVNGTTYDGIVLPTETVTFNSEQSKLTSNLNPTKDKDVRFSLIDNVEETKDLVAVHNVSPTKLLKTLKLGGLPMPSIAITRAREGYNQFGDISLVFGKDTIDPQFMRSNKVFSGDAWTPTYPQVAYKVNTKAQEQIKKKIDSIVPKNIQNDLGGLHLDPTNVEYELNRHGDMVTLYRYNYAMKYAFLKDNNVNIELPTKEEPLYRYGEVSNSAVISFAHKMVDGLKTVNSLLEQHSSKLMGDTDLINGIAMVLNEEVMSSVDENSEYYQKLVENPLFKAEDIDLSTVLGMLEAARKYFHSNGKMESKIDYRNAKGKIDDYFDSNSLEPEYEYWLKKLFSDIVAKEGIRNNKDLYTPSGNRRSFEALHYEHNLENVIKAMKEEGIKGIGGFGGGNIFGASTREYTSIDDIKADAKNRMEQLPKSKYDEIKKGFSDRLFELANSLPIHKDSFTALDDAANMLIEAVSKFSTKSGMANYLRTESKGWANYNDYIVDDLIQLVSEIRQMPVAYFEAKPQRAVGFDEIKAVIMPMQSSYEDDLSEVKGELEKLAVPILEYEYGDNDARIKALNSLEDVRFSEIDDEYLELAKDPVKNEERLREMVYEAAKKAGYSDDSSWRMGHTAPNSKDDVSLDKLKESGLIPDDFWEHPEWYTYSYEERDSYYKVKKAIENQEKLIAEGKPRDAHMWVYRAVDKAKNKREDYFRNGDWVTPSKEYAINEGKMNPNGYRIIKHSVSIKNLYWDGNSIAELGYDDGNNYAYADTLNNRKLLDLVTYYPSGEIIPLSKRFNRRDYDVKFSEIDDTSVYDIMGEAERIKKENEKLKADVERLNERLKLEGKVTHGKVLNNNHLLQAAGHLRNIGKSSIDKVQLAKELKEFFNHIINSEDVLWEDVWERSSRIAESILAEAKPEIMVDDYSKNILKEIRATKISLSEAQKKEAQHRFGKNWNRSFFGNVTITNEAIPLESKWQEWASMYPHIFDADTTETDMVEGLYDAIGSLRDTSEVIVEYDKMEQVRWMAGEVYNQFWNISRIETTADKYDKQIKELNAEHRRTMAELRTKYQEEVKKQRIADDMYYGRLYAKFRDKKNAEIAEAKKHGREMMDKYKENAEKRTRIQRITANALTLNKWLTKNSKDYHIHDAMKGPVVKLLNAIDFSSKRMLEKGEPTLNDVSFAEAFSEVKSMLSDATNMTAGLEELYGHDLAEDIDKLVKSTYKLVGDNNYVINAMSVDELISLDKLMRYMKKVVSEVNRFHIINHNQGAVNLAKEFMGHGKRLGNIKKQHGKYAKFFEFRNRTPYYFFKTLGNVGEKLFEAFQDGWDKLAFNAKRIIDFTEETYTEKEVKEWSKETKEFKLSQLDGSERTIKMSISQIMALHCVSKQVDAQRHLLSGGMTLKRIDKKGHVVADYENITLTISDVEMILSSLTDRQIEVADKLQNFMNTVCSTWGNEISMARFGIEQFGLPDYFPIKVSEATVPGDNTKDIDNASLFRLLNMSFTKARNDNAEQSIEIGDVFDIFAQHASDMAKYNALALPILDFNKFYSIKDKDLSGKEYGVVQTLKAVFGDEANGYIRRFVRDLNGSQNVSRDVLGNTFFKNAKIASVAANLRVILLQPTAFFKASAVMDNKYLLKASTYIKLEPIGMVKKLKKAIADAEKYCGIVQWKSLGYYDTDISKGLTEKIKHADSVKDKAIEKSMKGAEIADKVTFGTLWVACEYEIRDTRKDLKVGSKEFYDAIAKRLRDIIYATQVVDSTMTRSDMMRSSDRHDKMLTTFGSEPIIAYNMLLDMVSQINNDKKEFGTKEAIKKNAKKARKVVTAYVVTNAMAALIESAFDAFRDDDDDEMDVVEFMKLYLKNFAFDMSIGNKLPYIKEAYSFLQGYSSSRMDTQWLQYLQYALNAKKPAKKIKYMIQFVSQLSGLPFYNAYRDLMAALNKFHIFTADDLNEMFGDIED